MIDHKILFYFIFIEEAVFYDVKKPSLEIICLLINIFPYFIMLLS